MAQAARCSARAPKITLACATLAAAAASATLLIQAAALALGSLSGTGRSLLGECPADRPVGCDARCRGYVSYARMSSLRRMRVCGLRLPYCSSPCCSRSQRQRVLR
jgi:hypothetical protein